MKSSRPKIAPTSVAIGFFACALFLGVCADSQTRTAFAHGIINAFGIEYDNQASGLVAADVQAAIDEQDATNSAFDARIASLEAGGGSTADPNGDGVINQQELFDYVMLNLPPGEKFTLNDAESVIQDAEVFSSGIYRNGVLDTPGEVGRVNYRNYAPSGIPIYLIATFIN